MAKFHDVNTVATSGPDAIYRLIAVLVAAGWTKESDSDGSTYSATGVQVTSGAAGAGGLNNASAWVRMREPGGRREWTFQRAAANEYQWRVLYSALDRFTGGTPGATQTPSATDERIQLGAGTHAAPTYATLFPVGGGYRFHAIAQSTAMGGCYGFWALATTTPAGVAAGYLWQEPLAVGSYPAEDVDPCFRVVSNVALGFSTSWTWWEAYNLAGEVARTTTIGSIGGTGALVYAVSPYNSRLIRLPIYFSSTHWKGFTGYIHNKTLAAAAYPDTLDLTTDARVVLATFAFPWPENVAAIL